LVYVIEILTNSNKEIINAFKKDQQGVEYGCLYDLHSIEDAEKAIRNRWKTKGSIKIIKNGIITGVIDGSV
jgi:hypothetical protein